MKAIFLGSLLLLLTVAFSCNRKANPAVFAEPTVPKERPTVQKNIPSIEEMGETLPEDPGPVEAVLNIGGGKDPLTMRTPEGIAAAKANPEVVAELRKTPCYGDCPVFTLQVMTDGSLRYDGKKNTDLIGKYTGQPKSDPFFKVGAMAVKARFFNMADFYPEDADSAPKDLPRTVTTIDWRGRKKTVTHLGDGPEALVEIETYLEGLIMDAIWTPLEENKE